MSRFSQFVQTVTGSAVTLPQAIYLDLGSCNTRLRIGSKLAFQEPTCIAFHQKQRHTVSIGQAALDILGRTPSIIEVSQPIRRGKVANLPAAQEFVAAVLRKSLPTSLLTSSFWRPQVVCSSSSAETPTEKDAVQKIFQNLGYSRVNFVSKPTAILRRLKDADGGGSAQVPGSARSPKKLPKVLAILDIGGMTTELAFFSEGSVVVHKVLPLGGEDFTQAMIRTVRSSYHCEIGWQTAEKMKKSIGGIWKEHQAKKQMVIRGRDILTSLPTTLHISSEKFVPAFLEIAQEMIIGIQEVCQDAQPELVTEALDQGIFLTGGGSILPQLASYLEEQLRAPTTLSQTPFEDVVRGLFL